MTNQIKLMVTESIPVKLPEGLWQKLGIGVIG